MEPTFYDVYYFIKLRSFIVYLHVEVQNVTRNPKQKSVEPQ